MTRLIILVTFVIFSLSAGDAFANRKATILLQGEVPVSGPSIMLGDIAKISSPDASYIQALEKVRIGQAPWAGQSLTVGAGQVRMMLRSANLDSPEIEFPAPGSVRVIRASQVISGDELAEAAMQAILGSWAQADRIECDVLRKPSDVSVAAGMVEIVPQLSSTFRAGMVSVPVEIRVNGQRERSVSVSVRVRSFKLVVVTTSALARGQMLTASDLTMDEREVAGSTADMITDFDSVVGMRSTRPIAAGAVLRKSDVNVIPLVHRSSSVIIAAASRRIAVRSNGQALEDGQLGQVIRVRPDHTQEVISARVVGEGRVEVLF